MGEEFGDDGGLGRTRWYVDPIDGTHNFARGVPVFATLLAVEHDGSLEMSIVSAPALGRRWWATCGGGAWVRAALDPDPAPRRLRTSGVASIADAQVVFSSPRAVANSGRAPGFERLLERAWRERGFGDFWGYMLVAEGAAEAMIEVGINPYDLAAPALVVREAGGRVTDFGGDATIAGETVLASNGALHAELLRELTAAERQAPGERASSASASVNRRS